MAILCNFFLDNVRKQVEVMRFSWLSLCTLPLCFVAMIRSGQVYQPLVARVSMRSFYLFALHRVACLETIYRKN